MATTRTSAYLRRFCSPRSMRLQIRQPFRSVSSFASSPSPPRLPEDEQKIFEDLQKHSTGAFSTPRASSSPPSRPQVNQSPHVQPENLASVDAADAGLDTPDHAKTINSQAEKSGESALNARVKSTGKGDELHPDIRRGARPEFEGEINPKTGESGGPKNEPLRWGGQVDWSYNGRVTDF